MALTDEGLIHVPGVLSRYVRLANGARAHYVTSGETGPAVILIHGGIIGSSGTAGWRWMLPFLGQNGFRVYAPDLPGFGHADPREEYWPKLGWRSWVQFINDFADALCLDQFCLSGNSYGAMTAMEYTVSNPERVFRFAPIATGRLSWAMGVDRSLLKRSPTQSPPFDHTKASMFGLLDPITYRKEALTDDLLEMRTLAANAQYDANMSRRHTIGQGSPDDAVDPNEWQWASLRGRLDKLAIPMIYLHGLDDASAPVENSQLCEPLLPNIQFFYPSACGHQGQTDQPDLFNQVFLEFFRDGKVSRKTADAAGVSKNRPEIASVVEQAEIARV